jgi:hypothetical protein
LQRQISFTRLSSRFQTTCRVRASTPCTACSPGVQDWQYQEAG